MSRRFYLDSDHLLLLASPLEEKERVLSALEEELREESTLYTSVLAQMELVRYFEERGELPSLRYFLSLVRPLFEEVLPFTGEDLRRGVEAAEQLGLPGRESMVVGLLRNHQIRGIFSLSSHFGRVPGLIHHSLEKGRAGGNLP